MKPTIYQTITNQIVAAIEAGAEAYRMPWHRASGDITTPRNAVTGHTYRGLNILSLWAAAEANGYASGRWATYQQWATRGGQVRRGENSTTVSFWKQLDRENDQEAEADGQRGAIVARAFNVFSAEQVDGYEAEAVPVLSEAERIAAAERWTAAIPARIIHNGDQPCFIPSTDEVRMVPFQRFTTAAGYYTTLAHELAHWSGTKTRLDRDLSGRFGSASYAMEELVAELGAAFVAGSLALPSEPRRDHAPYIASWLKVLKNDSRAIFTAASKAQAAADYLLAFGADRAGG